MSEKPISPLGRRMIEDMTVREISEKTQSHYIRHIKKFTMFLGRSPDTAEAEDLRRFQLHQREAGITPPTMNGAVAALRFFFKITLGRPEVVRHLTLVRQPRRLPNVLCAGRGPATARSGAGAEVQGGLRAGVWRGPACVRGREPEGGRYRQPAHAAAHRSGQGQKGPARDALAAATGAAAGVVVSGAADRVAVPRSRSGDADFDTPALPGRARYRRGD